MSDTEEETTLSAVCSAYHAPDDAVELIESLRTAEENYRESGCSVITDFEFIACLPSSDTTTIEALEGIEWSSFELLVIENEAMTASRDAAIEAADGEYFAILDDDCVVAPDWLEAIARSMKTHEFPDCLQGAYYPDYPGGSRYSRLEEYRDKIRFNDGQADTRNCIMRKETYKEIGGFDTRFRFAGYGEDLFLPQRIENHGGRFVLDDSIRTEHKYPRTIRGNLRRFFYYGTGLIHVRRYDPDLYRHRYSPWRLMRYTAKQWSRAILKKDRDYNLSEMPYITLKHLWLFLGFLYGYWVYQNERQNLDRKHTDSS